MICLRRRGHPALTGESPDPNVPPDSPVLLEPLTGRETRVLHYLATTHLAGPEIAQELFVSVNTVRTHMRNIYAKLGAHRRAEAVDRAHTLGLLTHPPRRPVWSPAQIATQP